MRLRRVSAVVAALVALGTLRAAAQPVDPEDLSEALSALLEGAFTVHIRARIFDSDDNATIWDMDLTRVTIGGRTVSVRLDGSNMVVEADFTPYYDANDELMLVAEGRTWIETDDGEQEYRTAFTTLPIDLGEPILFLPLGTTGDSGNVPVDTEYFGRLNIELEINVERYSS